MPTNKKNSSSTATPTTPSKPATPSTTREKEAFVALYRIKEDIKKEYQKKLNATNIIKPLTQIKLDNEIQSKMSKFNRLPFYYWYLKDGVFTGERLQKLEKQNEELKKLIEDFQTQSLLKKQSSPKKPSKKVQKILSENPSSLSSIFSPRVTPRTPLNKPLKTTSNDVISSTPIVPVELVLEPSTTASASTTSTTVIASTDKPVESIIKQLTTASASTTPTTVVSSTDCVPVEPILEQSTTASASTIPSAVISSTPSVQVELVIDPVHIANEKVTDSSALSSTATTIVMDEASNTITQPALSQTMSAEIFSFTASATDTTSTKEELLSTSEMTESTLAFIPAEAEIKAPKVELKKEIQKEIQPDQLFDQAVSELMAAGTTKPEAVQKAIQNIVHHAIKTKNNHNAPAAEIIEHLHKIQKYLEKNNLEEFQEYANSMHGQPSLWMRVLGALLMALGVAFGGATAGIAYTTAPLTGPVVPTLAGTSASIFTSGYVLFNGGARAEQSKDVMELINAVENNLAAN